MLPMEVGLLFCFLVFDSSAHDNFLELCSRLSGRVEKKRRNVIHSVGCTKWLPSRSFWTLVNRCLWISLTKKYCLVVELALKKLLCALLHLTIRCSVIYSSKLVSQNRGSIFLPLQENSATLIEVWTFSVSVNTIVIIINISSHS